MNAFSYQPSYQPVYQGRKTSTFSLRRLSHLNGRMLAPSMRRRGQILSKLIACWPDIAGKAKGWGMPCDLSFARHSRAGGTLTIGVISAYAPQMHMMTPHLIERINQQFGFALIAHIRLKQNLIHHAPAGKNGRANAAGQKPVFSHAHLEKATSGIANPKLRDALIRLGQSL